MTLGGHLEFQRGQAAGGTKGEIRGLDRSAHPWASGRGEGLEMELTTDGQSCLCNEASVNTLNKFRELAAGECLSVPPTPLEHKFLSSGSFWTLPEVPLHLAVHLYPL